MNKKGVINSTLTLVLILILAILLFLIMQKVIKNAF